MSDTTTFIINQAIESWNTQLRQFDRVLNELTDESLMKQSERDDTPLLYDF